MRLTIEQEHAIQQLDYIAQRFVMGTLTNYKLLEKPGELGIRCDNGDIWLEVWFDARSMLQQVPIDEVLYQMRKLWAQKYAERYTKNYGAQTTN